MVQFKRLGHGVDRSMRSQDHLQKPYRKRKPVITVNKCLSPTLRSASSPLDNPVPFSSPSFTTPSRIFSPISALMMLDRRLRLKGGGEGDNVIELSDPSASLPCEDEDATLGRRADTVDDEELAPEVALPITSCLTPSHWAQERLNHSRVLWIVPPRDRCSVKYFCSKSIELSNSHGRKVRS